MKNNTAVDYLKLFFALGIVALHTGFLLNFQSGFYVHAILFRLGVPFFFLTAGYYLAAKNKDNDNKTIADYIKKLIYLYLILSTCYLIINMFRYNAFNPGTLLDGFWFIFTGRSQSVMWFVGALITSCIILMHVKDEKKLRISLTIALILYGVGLLFNTYAFLINNENFGFLYNFLVHNFTNNSNAFFEGYFFVGIGYYLNKYGKDYKFKYNIICLVIGFLVLIGEVILVHNHIDKVVNYEYYLSHIILIPSIFLCLLKIKLNCKSIFIRKLSSYIYYFHYVFIILLIWINDLYPNKLLSNSTYFYIITVGITIIYSILFYFMIKKIKIKKDILKYVVILLYTISFIGAIYAIITLINKVVWADEICSLAMIRNNFKEIFSINAQDVHPPFYYIMLKLFVDFLTFINSGFDVIILGKVFSFIPYVLALVLINTKIRKNHGILTSSILTFFITFMPQLMVNFVELRMYSWGMLLVLVSYVYLFDAILINTKKSWILFTIFSTLAVYVHFYSCLSMVFMYAFLLCYAIIKNKSLIKKIILSGLFVSVCYLPWLVVIIKHLAKDGSGFWISPITFSNVIEYVKYVVFPTSDSQILNIFLGFAWIVSILFIIFKYLKDSWKNNDKFLYIIGILVLIFIVGTGILVSILINPLFVSRYMFFGIGIFWLSIALMFGKLLEKNSSLFIILIIPVLIGSINFNSFIRTEIDKNKTATVFYDKINKLDKSIDIVANEVHVQFLFAYFLPNSNVYLYKQLNADHMMKMYGNVMGIGSLDEIKSDKKYYLENIYMTDYKQDIYKEKYELDILDNLSMDMYTINFYEIIKE